MDPATTTAIAALLVALISGLISLKTQRNQLKAEAENRHRERKLSVQVELDALREPLLGAAKDLQQRIRNIQVNKFFHYLQDDDEHRQDVALLGTLYRFARYWALQELLYKRVNLLLFESEPGTKDIGKLVASIAATFATDRFREGPHLMFWREEQRAVAELMLDSTREPSAAKLVEFASFSKRYREDEGRESKEDIAHWLSSFARDLRSNSIHKSERLKELQEKLALLVEELENGRMGRMTGESKSKRWWGSTTGQSRGRGRPPTS